MNQLTYGISFMNSDTLLYLLQNVDGRSDILHITHNKKNAIFSELFDTWVVTQNNTVRMAYLNIFVAYYKSLSIVWIF